MTIIEIKPYLKPAWSFTFKSISAFNNIEFYKNLFHKILLLIKTMNEYGIIHNDLKP